WTFQPRPPQRRTQGFERMSYGIRNGCALEAAVGHAVVAAGVAAHTVALPLGLLHQRAEGRCVTFVGEQITGPLPAKDVVGGVAPGRALISLVAGEKVEIKS